MRMAIKSAQAYPERYLRVHVPSSTTKNVLKLKSILKHKHNCAHPMSDAYTMYMYIINCTLIYMSVQCTCTYFTNVTACWLGSVKDWESDKEDVQMPPSFVTIVINGRSWWNISVIIFSTEPWRDVLRASRHAHTRQWSVRSEESEKLLNQCKICYTMYLYNSYRYIQCRYMYTLLHIQRHKIYRYMYM